MSRFWTHEQPPKRERFAEGLAKICSPEGSRKGRSRLKILVLGVFVDSFLRCIWSHTDTLFTNFYGCDLKIRESFAKAPRKPWLAGMAPPLIVEWQCPLRSGTRGVWLCPLKSSARGWGPAVPTEIWSSRLRVGWRTRRLLPNCKTMSVVHFTAENRKFLSHVFGESSRKCISDTWMLRKKNCICERFAKEMAKGKTE